jgi:cell division protein FtsZ
VIARSVREQGILTVGVVTKPFHFEGAHRMRVAEGGLAELQQYVDTLIVIPNQNLFRIANERTTFADAFKLADNVLHMGVRGVTDLMVMPGLINLDFADIRTVMSEMGKAMMGTGEADGERRAIEAAEAAISNPLLDEVSMKGARGVLINITGGPDMTLFEVDEAANRIREEVDPDANIIVGSTLDESINGEMRVSVVATGIEAHETRAAVAAAAAAASPAAPAAPAPSFRLRPQAAKPPAGVEAPAGASAPAYAAHLPHPSEPPAQAPQAHAQRSQVVAQPDTIRQPSQPPRLGEPGYPPLPPHERFQEWGKLRAPVRDVERGPSLFERVTASFGRQRSESRPEQPERVAERVPEPAMAGEADERRARAEEDVYDIPAFLRR